MKRGDDDAAIESITRRLEKVSLMLETKNFALDHVFSRVIQQLNKTVRKSDRFLIEKLDCSEKEILELAERLKNVDEPTKVKCLRDHRIETKIICASFEKKIKRCNEKMVMKLEITRNSLEESLEKAKSLHDSLKISVQNHNRTGSHGVFSTDIETNQMLKRVKKIDETLDLISNDKQSFEPDVQTLILCHTVARNEVTKEFKKLLNRTEKSFQGSKVEENSE